MGYWNQYHYADPTAGAAIGHVVGEERKEARQDREAGIRKADEFLKRGRKLEAVMASKQQQIAHLHAIAEQMNGYIIRKDGGSKAGKPVGMEEAVVQIEEIIEDLAEAVSRYAKVWREIADVIGRVKNEKYRMVLEKYYLSDMGSEEIAEEMGRHPRYIFQVRKRALDEVGRMIG